MNKKPTAPNRRELLGLGLTAGAATLFGPAAGAEDALETGTATAAGDNSLRFRVSPDYRPDLSENARRALTSATLDFLHDSHPPHMTLALWEKNPRDLPYLEQHIDAIVGAVFAGVEAHVATQPVDPVLIVALIYNESRFSPIAISPAGAVGMAQFMPNTALEYQLNPVARLDLWRRYRQVRKTERNRRRQQQIEFMNRHGIARFSSAAVIAHTLDNGKLDVLAEYQQLANVPKLEDAALDDYIAAVREELARFDFFGDGEEAVGRLDARASYASATAAVDYIAQRLAENSGMTSSAVAAYNAGPAAVRDDNPRSVLFGYGDPPAYPETVRYVQRVLVVHSKLRDLMA